MTLHRNLRGLTPGDWGHDKVTAGKLLGNLVLAALILNPCKRCNIHLTSDRVAGSALGHQHTEMTQTGGSLGHHHVPRKLFVK